MQRPSLERELVVDAEMLLPVDELTRVLQRGPRICAHRVPHRRVDGVEDQDRDDLEPPVQAAPVAQRPAAWKAEPLPSDRAAHSVDSSPSPLLADDFAA